MGLVKQAFGLSNIFPFTAKNPGNIVIVIINSND